MRAILSKRSLRFWILMGIVMSMTPLAISAIAGYILLDREVVRAFDDVADRQRHQAAPLLHLRMQVWDTLIPVDEYIEGGVPAKPAYEGFRNAIEADFQTLEDTLSNTPEAAALLSLAKVEWEKADAIATSLISVAQPEGEPVPFDEIKAFHKAVVTSATRVTETYDLVYAEIQKDHDLAIIAYDRSRTIALLAAGLSILMMFAGAAAISRIMGASVDRLVDGAERFAYGDRKHRIEVNVPPELHRVAEEFNRMIGRISDTELALSELARRDGLTRLLNRRAFDETMSELQAKSQREKLNVALLTLDIDHFKRINDKHGHTAGDDVLRKVAKTVSAEVRPFDNVYRTGGEEFAVLLSDVDIETARNMAERLRKAVEAVQLEVKNEIITPTVSIGVAIAPDPFNPAVAIDRADEALYAAKNAGRNRVIVNDDMAVVQDAAHIGNNVSKAG